MSVTTWDVLDEGKLLVVRLARPKANILDAEMIGELDSGIKSRVTRSTRAVVVSHEGPHFSFGASVEEHTKERAAEMLSTFHGLFRTIHQAHVPFLAAVRGQCLGGGFELAGFCHMVFADEAAKFGQPEIVLGVFPPMASLILNIKAPGLADEINLSGRTFTADEFKAAGLIQHLNSDPEQTAIEYAKKHFLPKSARSLRYAVQANRMVYEAALNEKLPELERLYLDELMASHDANEGINSFLEKRSPQWTDQ